MMVIVSLYLCRQIQNLYINNYLMLSTLLRGRYNRMCCLNKVYNKLIIGITWYILLPEEYVCYILILKVRILLLLLSYNFPQHRYFFFIFRYFSSKASYEHFKILKLILHLHVWISKAYTTYVNITSSRCNIYLL